MYSYMASTCNGLVNSILGMYKLSLPWVYRYIGHLIASLVRMHSTVDLMYKFICRFLLYLYSHLSFDLITLQVSAPFTCGMQFYYLTTSSQPSYKVVTTSQGCGHLASDATTIIQPCNNLVTTIQGCSNHATT